jgi:hypothetical protein
MVAHLNGGAAVSAPDAAVSAPDAAAASCESRGFTAQYTDLQGP